MSQNKNKGRAFLVETEKLNPIVLKHLKNKGDILTLRTLQGEMAELYRLLAVETNGITDNLFLEVELNPANGQAKNDGWPINKKTLTSEYVYAHSMKDAIIHDVLLKHVAKAVEELRELALECILEDIKEVPVNGDVEELTSAKKVLEGLSSKNGTKKEDKSS